MMGITDRVKRYVGVAGVVVGACALSSCSSGHSQPPPPPAVSVTIASKITTANANIDQVPAMINATVSNDSTNAGVTWTLTSGNPPSACAPACGTLSGLQPLQVTYTPPIAVPAVPTNTPTIIATSVADSSKSDSDQFTIQYPTGSVSLLTGTYSFQMTGFDAAGHPMAAEGSFTSNADGTISSFSLDVNDNLSATSSGGPSLTATYTLDSSFRGVISLGGTIPGVAQNPKFAFSLTSDGELGHLISFDANGYVMTGYFSQVDKGAFSLGQIAGEYAFTFDSQVPARNSVIGRFSLDSSGNITNGLSDSAEAGVGPSASTSAFTGTVSPIDATSGRATVSVMTNGKTSDYVLYVNGPHYLFLMQTDAASGTLQAGVTSFQNKKRFSSSSANGTAVMVLEGFDTAAATRGPIAVLGQISVTNSTSGALTWDSNDGGTVFTQQSVTGQNVTLDPTTGRGTLTIAGGFSNGLFDSAVFYLTNSGSSYVLDTTAGANNRALAGRFLTQDVAANLVLDGNVITEVGGPGNGGSEALSVAIPSVEGFVNASNGVFTGVMDGRIQGQPDFSGTPFNGTYSAIDTSTGRATGTLPGAMFGQANPVACVFYALADNAVGALSITAKVPSDIIAFNQW